VGWNNPIPVVWNAMVPSYDWLKWDVTVSFDIWLNELTWVVWMVVFDTDSYNTYGPTYHPINILFLSVLGLFGWWGKWGKWGKFTPNLTLRCQTCGANVVGQMFYPLIPFTPKR
jgi:hypothetical protein